MPAKEIRFKPRGEAPQDDEKWDLPDLRKKHDVAALAVSCIHLSDEVPLARQAEPNWQDAMGRSLKHLWQLRDQYHVPILCCGDVFHKFDPTPGIINFALRNMPPLFAVPGNHDLPNHDYQQLHRTAFGTLVAGGIITLLCPDYRNDLEGVSVYAYPCGFPLRPCPDPPKTFGLNVSVAHSYVWMDGYNFPNAPEADRIDKVQKRAKGYDVAIFGDNHIGFKVGNLVNCGCFIPRRSDERSLRPFVAVIHDDGRITKSFIPTDKDKWVDQADMIRQVEKRQLDLSGFVEELQKLGLAAVDFRAAVDEWLKRHKTDASTKDKILSSMPRVT